MIIPNFVLPWVAKAYVPDLWFGGFLLWFYEGRSDVTRQNKTLSLLVSMPNVIVTSHQAFLTHEALANIAQTTLANLDAYFAGAPLENEICYRCLGSGGANKTDCPRRNGGRCH